ncbi:hypothetical protein HID58_024895 [Brassica napus]|uniref:Uncharacterized protein n=1 Tax=Brassica napus TaxID=3708 RepID=A0ABQ8CJL8_BRANA|nr:histone chaperone ASF1-like [Brassica napus]KAH0917235.1 hypothetical protein HID58_024895 [Brassica napus]
MASLPSASFLPSPSLVVLSPTKIFSSSSSSRSIVCSSSRAHGFSSIPRSSPSLRMTRSANHNKLQVVAMAPEEEKLTRRNPLDFPIEWERPKPGRRPDIFPKFSPMKTPLPPPMPYDPPAEDDEEEEEKKEEEEENPDQEEEEQPDKQQ